MNTLEWLSRLVAFDTTSRNSNLDLINDIKDWFSVHQIESRLISSPNEPKANLFATIPASNGDKEGGIIFSGHTDVVPIDGQDWKTNPFDAVLIDDRVYGRGTCDMKGFIAVCLALVPEFKKMFLNQPIHFAFSYDEEIGCKGAPLIIEDLKKLGIKPKACIVGEPTNMRPVIAHKGIQVYRCRVHGQAAHSSLTPKGCNAIEYAARLICFIRDIADEMRQKGPFDSHYDVPFTSMSTNLIQGGNAHNTIPAECEFYFEFRNLPEVKPREVINRISSYVQNDLLPEMQEEVSTANIEIDNIAIAPSFEANHTSSIQQKVYQLLNEQEIKKVAYATEAGLFADAEIPTLVCGPGDIEQAHRANEFVTVEQLKKCASFLKEIVKYKL